MHKSPEAFRTISEVAEALETPAHVLRFWETRFPQIRPVKRAGGRRYYRPSDVALLSGIKRLLHEEGMTIRGVQKVLREQGIRHVAGLGHEVTPEEEALEAAMPERLDAEPDPVSPEQAGEATVHALRSALGESADTADSDAAETGQSARVIAFPLDTTKETEVPDHDPRQIAFPGFEPEDELVQPVESPELTAEEEEAPFAFDVPPDADPLPAPVTRLDLPAAATAPATGAADELRTEEQDDPGAEATALSFRAAGGRRTITAAGSDNEAAAAPSPETPAPGSAEEAPPLPAATIAARLRALPPGRLADRHEALSALSQQIAALRARLSQQSAPPQRSGL